MTQSHPAPLTHAASLHSLGTALQRPTLQPRAAVAKRPARMARAQAEPLPADLLAMFASHVALSPQRLAAQCGANSMTYGELDRRSTQLARLLLQVGVGAEALVAVHLRRSLELLVAMLAVLKAGGAYLPLDPEHPPERIRAIVDDARPRVVIESARARVIGAEGETMHICLDEDGDCIASFPSTLPELEVHPQQLAYVIFTSGSTGRPKGVQICRGTLANYLRAMVREPGLSAADKSLALATVSFDMSVFDFWLPLYVGASMVIGDDDLARDVKRLKLRLEEGDISFLHVTPTTLRMLLDAGWQGDPRMRVLSGGESLTRELASAVLARVHALYNGYGPTEATVCTTLWKVTANDPISIGTPIDGVKVYVLDADRKPLPDGEEGELWIGGASLARDYLGRPDLTRERFVADPFDARPGQRMYRTGDLVRRADSGELFFIARVDDQVKLRGFRIELGEIEAALEGVAGVQAAVVKLHRHAQTGAEQLAAYYVSTAELEGDALREHAATQLPAYMVPSSFDRIAQLPRTASGKLDRRALPEPQPARRAAGDETLDSDLERAVAAAFAEVFALSELLPSDDFFALGGTSLLALRFQAALEARTGEPFALKLLFERRSVRAIAAALSEHAPTSGGTVLALHPHGSRAPVFCLFGIYHYQPLAEALADVDRPFYGVYVPAEDAVFCPPAGTAPSETLRSLASHYVEAIRKRQKHGPYCLMGHSTGGILAFEAARQLSEAGETVEQLVLLDSVLPRGVKRALPQAARHALRLLRRRVRRGLRAAESALLRATRRHVPRARRLEQRLQESEQEQRELRRIRAYELAEAHWERHLAAPYAGTATFVHALGRREPCGEVEPTAGWSALVKGGVQVRAVDCEHAAMMRTPHVERLVELLRPVLLDAPQPLGQAD